MRLHHKLRRKFSEPPPPPISFQNHSVFKENVKNMSHIEFMYNQNWTKPIVVPYLYYASFWHLAHTWYSENRTWSYLYRQL